NVILGASSGIPEDMVCLGQHAKLLRVARGLIVRMETLREQTIDAVDGVRISVRADLQHLVIVDDAGFGHPDRPLSAGQHTIFRQAAAELSLILKCLTPASD